LDANLGENGRFDLRATALDMAFCLRGLARYFPGIDMVLIKVCVSSKRKVGAQVKNGTRDA
jgi:hypothetical protein